MERSLGLHPWDIRRLSYGDFRRRAEHLLDVADSMRDKEAMT